MANKQMQDVVPPGKRSIRNVPLPQHRRRQNSAAENKRTHHTTDNTHQTPPPPPSSYRPTGISRVPRWSIWTIAVVSVVVVVFAASTFFTSATVKIAPKHVTRSVDSTIVSAASSSDAAIHFETISLSESEQTSMTATATAEGPQRATGEITVYNEYTSEPIQLVKGTRYKTQDGQVYRSPEAITIPGKEGDEPGTVAVSVRATETGNSFNVPEGTTFQLPGLKGDPSYAEVYAKAPDGISGGSAEGGVVIPPSEKQSTKQELEDTLKTKLRDDIRREVPDSYVLYPELIVINTGALEQTATDDKRVTIEMSGEAYGYMLPRLDLAAFLVEDTLPDKFNAENIDIKNLDELTFTPAGSVTEDMDTVRGAINGDVTFVWNIDKDKIKKEISGVSKQQIGSVLSGYTAVERASAEVKPFWLSAFPSSSKSIFVMIASSSPAAATNATSSN